MATDPIQLIHEEIYDSPLDLQASDVLRQLAALPPSLETPYLTISLDWRPEGTQPGRANVAPPKRSERRAPQDVDAPSWRPSRQMLDQQLQELLAAHGPRGVAFESLSADVEQITAYLDSELDPAAQGVFIVACSATGVFTPLALGLPVPSTVSLGPTPALSVLVQVIDDFPTYAALVADQREATLTFVTQAVPEQSVHVEGTDFPRKQQQGGWSQRRYQLRAEERISAFARGVAEEMRQDLEALKVNDLIIAGDEVITSALNGEMHQTVKDRIIGTLNLDIRASDSDVIDATFPIAQAAERQREAEAVRQFMDLLGAGGDAAAGPADTVMAAQSGQIGTLLMNDDFNGKGWADYALPFYGAGPVPATHPAGGDVGTIVPISLREELVWLTLQNGGDVQIIKTELETAAEREDIPEPGEGARRTEPAASLDAFGGVGAILRFSITEDDSTAPQE